MQTAVIYVIFSVLHHFSNAEVQFDFSSLLTIYQICLMVHQPGWWGCQQFLTYHQCQLAHQLTQANQLAVNKEINMVLDHVNREAKHLSQKFKQSVPWFLHQFYQGM